MKKEKQICCENPERLGKVGGQAVLEGVMMKAGERTVTTCRKDDGSIVVYDDSFKSVRKKYKILNLPLIRGVVNFVEMMALSFKTLEASADAMGIEEEDGKVERWLKKYLGVGIVDIIMVISMMLGILLAAALFMFLPNFAAELINRLVVYLGGSDLGAWQAAISGVMKVAIFITYLSLVTLMPDIKRTFMYHGAEHKTIACFEAGDELTPENAMKHKRFHPRCGTSFMFFMIMLGMIVGMVIRMVFPGQPWWVYALISLGTLPIVVGIGYEFIMFAGKHNNIITRLLSAPGLWVQRITTKEPTPDMLEIAIISTKCALRDEFSEFREFYESRPWETSAENQADSEAEISKEQSAEQGDGEVTEEVAE